MAVKTPSPREAAFAEVARHQEVLARWNAEKATAEVELASMLERIGDEVLADESAAGGLARSMQELRDRIEIADRAVVAAQTKVGAASRDALLADVEQYEAEVVRRRADLAAHEEKTAQLLALLEEHEGRFVSGATLAMFTGPDVISSGPDPMAGARRPKSEELRERVRRAELRVFVLREIAEGRDPDPHLVSQRALTNGLIVGVQKAELYPPSVWGPAAIVPAPAYVRHLEASGPATAQQPGDRVAALTGAED